MFLSYPAGVILHTISVYVAREKRMLMSLQDMAEWNTHRHMCSL